MRKVGVRTLKAQASELLRAVEDGEEIVVTRRGQPIARLDRVDSETPRPMRLRGLFADLAPVLEEIDVVEAIRQLRQESTADLEKEYGRYFEKSEG